jgi:hypothetical protein
VVVLAFLALDPNHVFYGMAGMETQIAVAALLVALLAHERADPRTGLAVGVALLARPDLVMLAGAIGLAMLVQRRGAIPRYVAGIAVVVGPWLLFTTLYYGSPVPQTIVAKAAAFTSMSGGSDVASWLGWVLTSIQAHVGSIVRTFAPFLTDSLARQGPIPIVVSVVFGVAMLAIGVVGAFARHRSPAWWPLILFVAVYLVYRVFMLPPVYFDWYLPPFTAVAIFLVAAGIQALSGARHGLAAATAMVVIVGTALPLPWQAGLEQRIQTEVEDAVRTRASVRLGELVEGTEPVATEAAGSLGYFSRVTLYDYPGLTSRAALEVVRALPDDERLLVAMIDRMRPLWIVLRPVELEQLRALYPETAALYEEVERFGAGAPEVEWGGYVKTTVDSQLLIMRRRP